MLCSLLIGSGYDAYCVYGAAPKHITTKDESLIAPLNIELPEDSMDPEHDSDEEQMIEKKAEEGAPVKDFELHIQHRAPLVSEGSKFVEKNLKSADEEKVE